MVGVSGETAGCNTSGGKYGGSDKMSARGGGDGGDASGETVTKYTLFYILEENTQTYIVNLHWSFVVTDSDTKKKKLREEKSKDDDEE